MLLHSHSFIKILRSLGLCTFVEGSFFKIKTFDILRKPSRGGCAAAALLATPCWQFFPRLTGNFKMGVIYVMAFLKLAGLFFTCLQQLGAFERIEK